MTYWNGIQRLIISWKQLFDLSLSLLCVVFGVSLRLLANFECLRWVTTIRNNSVLALSIFFSSGFYKKKVSMNLIVFIYYIFFDFHSHSSIFSHLGTMSALFRNRLSPFIPLLTNAKFSVFRCGPPWTPSFAKISSSVRDRGSGALIITIFCFVQTRRCKTGGPKLSRDKEGS